MSDIMSTFSWLYGKPVATGKLKQLPEHFIVKEVLGFTFTGKGEHLMVKIRKTGENTKYVANELAKFCGVKSKDISWAGLKDRHAITEQWLSVHLPKSDHLKFALFEATHPGVEILEMTRHNKKLRPGDLLGNSFQLIATEVTDMEDVLARLEKVKLTGVPNYFGAQRFGHEGNNVTEARRWGRENVRTRDNTKRSFYLSAARSWIFNHIVSQRITEGYFTQPVDGDILLDQNGRTVNENVTSEENIQKVQNGDWSISAALAGDNQLPTSETALTLEQPQLDAEPDLMALIRGNRMRHERRAIELHPENLSWSAEGDTLTLNFSLTSGSFATVIMRELLQEIEVERTYE
ncbi:tRNA pseudouridine(13) synthase TruD [Aliivibrio sp. S4TY2]|uniref:tRNA pseudouridine(13) synthase TruD n=1 Tax=unclassified Aliivibrio TaxID=2645654 RepID=UPI00237997D5|nr:MULTISPECIES: tRNA pseudouridine(13) synthase TruD [unclassified Aliivibrio]MDD9155011.1 tRNA pseudouridine(13) synthase TruD [Aliivibrio sp. S4TY2]MDD9158626.1 tRNA pseudouridine(13) synthase TruD [Aliivibrio sp. S4TY1]MDD9163014.1 tRNA pseudouridine(13) synthase TruD [Aliivibrio sp. S4MY2]MDD9166625.1 tRNA pseudouridine(13) synthase TruD [Aliivibrio sp. S4MY4]MDD9184091.1 tRNA pseudouridine(13) synthase TruD [Aliivibrio sp. S4MY3]